MMSNNECSYQLAYVVAVYHGTLEQVHEWGSNMVAY